MVTDTTFDILERAENDFNPDFSIMLPDGPFLEKFPKYERTTGYLFLKFCQCEAQDPLYRERPEDMLNLAMYHTVELLCLPAMWIIKDLFDNLSTTASLPVDMSHFHYMSKSNEVPWDIGPTKTWETL